MAILPYSIAISSEPAIEPVSVDDAKRNCDEDDNARDADFAMWITEARKRVEDEARRALITRTYVLKLDRFPPDDYIELPYPPAIAISSIQYIDTAGSTQTWSSGDYSLDVSRTPSVVLLGYSASYPSTRDDRNAVTVTYTAGYGTAETDVPEAARAAIHLLVKQRYDNPATSETPPGYDALITRLAWGSYP